MIDYERPVPENLRTVELKLDFSDELARFANSLLHGLGGGSLPKAAVLQMIQTPSGQSRRGYILPPARKLDDSEGSLCLTLGIKNRQAVPVPVPVKPAAQVEQQLGALLKQRRASDDDADRSPKRSRVAAHDARALDCDLPELSVAREAETNELRQHMAELVRSLGPSKQPNQNWQVREARWLLQGPGSNVREMGFQPENGRGRRSWSRSSPAICGSC